jgi:uncharacterized protein
MRAAASFAVLMLACSLAAPVAAQEKAPPTITVVGAGIVAARPDLATVSVGVIIQARNAQDALAQNSKLTAELIAAARQAGIAQRDLETQRISLQPQYAQPPQGSREARRISGYEARNTLQVRVRDLDKLGALLDQLATSGANQIGGIALSVAEPRSFLDQARAAAVKDALRKAELFAEAAGLRVVRLLALEEVGAEVPRPLMRLAAAPPRDRIAVPIEAGEQEFRAGVNATFEVAPK